MEKTGVDVTEGTRQGGYPYLLAHLSGARPPAPAWFEDALAMKPMRRLVAVDDCPIELLTWGTPGAPGLIFLHGNGAHADWWSFIAPLFATTHHVAAISWSGMGGSGWRQSYDMQQFVREIMAAGEAAGLFNGGRRPIVVAHSFGASPMLECLAQYGERFALGVAVDKGFPVDGQFRSTVRSDLPVSRRLFPTLEHGLARFRLSPAQPCENIFIIDMIARSSLRLVDDEDLGLSGWGWAFDPGFRTTIGTDHIHRTKDLITRSRAPLAFLYGGRSALISDAMKAQTRHVAPAGSYFETIADADHHVMLDQPLAFVAALRRSFEGMRAREHQ